MKKILTIAAASIAVAAIADSFSPDIGVTTLSLSLKNNVIPVQFNSLADSGSVKAGDLVCTNNIPLNSYLFVYNDGSYTAWQLVESGWNPLDVASGTAEAAGITYSGNANSVSLPAGSAIWLSFPAAQSPAKLVSFYGKVATSTNTTITAGTKQPKNPVSTLVCNPTGGDISGEALVEMLTSPKFVPVANDKIRFDNSTNGEYYIFNGTKWGRLNGNYEFVEGLPTLYANKGFWYVSLGGAGTISW